MKNILKSFLFSLIIISFIPACSDYNYQEPEDDETGSISFNVEWKGAPSLIEEPGVYTRALDCSGSYIETVTFEIADTDDRRLAWDSWPCIAGEGIVYGVPAGTDRKLIVEGKDDQDRVLYRGEIEGIVVTAGKHTDVETVTCEPVEIIDVAYLQYRTYADAPSEYRGWIGFTKQGGPIDLFDIPQVSLKSASGNTVSVSEKTFYSYEYYSGKWNDSTSSVEFSGPLSESGFTIKFPQGTFLPAGNYTYEATTSQETLIRTTLYFPGETVLPTVDITSMFSEWVAPDNSLHLWWDTPDGEYDELRIIVIDQDYNDLLYVTLPADAYDLMVPGVIVQNITDLRNPSSARWVVQTRSYTATMDNNNYARGYSMFADIPSWQP